MSQRGTSKRGRGGGAAGGRLSSSTLSAYNFHSSVNLRPLPAQYTFTQHTIPETQAPRSQPPPPLHVPSQPPPPPHQLPNHNQPPQNEQAEHQPPPNEHEDRIPLEALLTMPGVRILSPNIGEGLWFDRDEKLLVKEIGNILQDKFDGPNYSWSVTPTVVQDRYFVTLAVLDADVMMSLLAEMPRIERMQAGWRWSSHILRKEIHV